MSLDLTKVAAQIWGMVAGLKAGDEERRKHLQYALDVLRDKSIDLDQLRKRIDDSQRKTTWLVAGLVDGLDQHYKPPPLPEDFTVIATDGSHIDVDRHKSTRCYLINIGAAVLDYGTRPDARLDSFPHLYSGDEDLVIAPDKGREQLVEGPLLGIKRSVEEIKYLAALAAELPKGSSTLALLDGSLILWGLEAYPEFVTEALLDKGFIPCLEEIRKLRRLPLPAISASPALPMSLMPCGWRFAPMKSPTATATARTRQKIAIKWLVSRTGSYL